MLCFGALHLGNGSVRLDAKQLSSLNGIIKNQLLIEDHWVLRKTWIFTPL
jgi:hypothetical protein